MQHTHVNKRNKRFIIYATLCVVLLATLAGLRFTHHFPFSNSSTESSQSVTSANSETKGESGTTPETAKPNSSTSTSSPASSDQPGDQKATPSASATLVAPHGDFVSNHHPNLSGSPAPNILSSVCSTTAGASCTITFTKDGTTKSLTAQTTDRGGSTYWSWKLSDVGLTAGSWQVTARASLNNQTLSTTDSMTLEVSP